MPFIKQKRREECQPVVDAMIACDVKADGDLHWILITYCKYQVTRRYNAIKNFRAELRECADEIKHRILDPYEDEKKEENGDI